MVGRWLAIGTPVCESVSMFVKGCRLLLASLLGAIALAGPVEARPSDQALRVPSDWQGSREAMPKRYSWLNQDTPVNTYTIVVVRGVRPAAVLKRLGGVKRQTPDKTPDQALAYVVEHLGPNYSWPRLAQVQRRGRAVVIYMTYGFLLPQALARLSGRGVATEFTTTIELDTFVTVAKHGKIRRQFDAGFKPPRKGALPSEAGLDWGTRRQNIWATAWAFNERVTLTHISREWFEGSHPTFIMKKGALY